MAEIDYSLMKAYFDSVNQAKFGVVMGIITAISILVALCALFEGAYSVMFVSFGCVAIFGFGAVFQFQSIKKLPIVLEEIEESIGSRIVSMAVNSLGLDIEQCNIISPVIISGDAYSNNFNQFAYHTVDDFTSNHCYLVLLFSENQMFYYVYTFSLISDEENVTSGEFFYKDVVAFKTESKKMELTLNNTQPINKSKLTFSLMTTGGNAFEMPINKKDEGKIQGMRQLLREKKNTMN